MNNNEVKFFGSTLSLSNEYLVNIENEIIENFQDEVLKGNINLKEKYGHFENHIYPFVNEYVERHLTYRSEQIKAIVELSLYQWHKMNHPTSTCMVAQEGILEALLKSGRVYREANYKIETYKLFPNI
tara:strand:+ start:732 stop:1115 length:384 start_codon:yes stop_codon:yes gene_type:complete